MITTQWVKREFKAVVLVTLYFACWVGVLFVMKNLLLLKYSVNTFEWAAVVFGVLLLSKVVLVLERVPIGRVLGRKPAWVDVIARTVLYTVGVAIVLAIERGVKGWSEHGGFVPALEAAIRRRDPEHVWANTMGVCSAILGYNALAVVRRNIGGAALLRMFLTPLPREGGGGTEGSGDGVPGQGTHDKAGSAAPTAE